ncbi:MAG: DeoR/GlpR family DNA-binding transcription regulator [Sphaerochaeta sp.]|nr:DeoR/GlpR family DNA-binding transcription regulator [Sphaerochaeta sp.]PKL28169.1 MAG: DeoR/GlpR transcriptional regulator [Spirochaetae bacterium HGW-Spirochaetae-2]
MKEHKSRFHMHFFNTGRADIEVKMIKREKRIQDLTNFIKVNNACSISELSTKFNVSEMTIRRDLAILESNGIVRYLHGGALYNPGLDSQQSNNEDVKDFSDSDYLFNQQIVKHRDDKIAIARKASTLLEPDESVMIDSGTTMSYLCREIENTFSFTAVCWSLNVLVELSRKPNCKLISYGGYFHSQTKMFENPYPSDFMKYTRASKVFISAGGVHPQLGVTCPLSYESETKRKAIESSKTSILLVDASKFGKVCPTHFANIEDFDIIVTNDHLEESMKQEIVARGVRLILV